MPEGNITIEWHARCHKLGDVQLPPAMMHDLRERVIERVCFLLKDGYHSGELLEYIDGDVPGHKPSKNGYEFSGWININHT